MAEVLSRWYLFTTFTKHWANNKVMQLRIYCGVYWVQAHPY